MRLRYTLLPALGLAASLSAQSPITLSLEQVATGLTRIIDISHAGDDRLFLTLQAGSIRIMDGAGTLLPTPFLNITTQVNSAGNEQGLLGMTFDPDYANNGRIYVYYTFGTGAGTSRISRFTVSADPNVADPLSEEILYTQAQPYTNHNGGDLQFGPDGYLYVGFGDGGSGGDPQGHAQNLGDVLGSMIRIDVSGATGWTVPPDNPFVNTPGAMPEIFAYGIRNPWRWGFDALTGDLWIGDVGQNAYEEVDFWPAGDLTGPNFGWRCYEGNTAYNTAGCQAQSTYDAPVSVHPQSTQGWCSVIGGRVYRGPSYWRLEGRYLYTDYCGGQFYSLVPDGAGAFTRTQLFASGIFGFSCIGENSALEMYAGNNSTGRLYKIKELCTDLPPELTHVGDTLTSTPAASYAWYFNGALIPNQTGQSLTATNTGIYHVLATFTGGCQLLSDTMFISLVGIEGNELVQLSLHPVPASGLLTIDGLTVGAARLQLVDNTGRTVVDQRIASGSTRVTIDTAPLSNGNYVLTVSDKEGAPMARQKVSVAH